LPVAVTAGKFDVNVVAQQRAFSMSSDKRNAIRGPAYAFALAVLLAAPLSAQHERGEIRLEVHDPNAGALPAAAELTSSMDQVQRRFVTDEDGRYTARELPFGAYRLRVSRQGFVPAERLIKVRSEIPVNVSVTLGIAPLEGHIEVADSATLVDPERTGTIYSTGAATLSESIPAQLGHGVINAVDAEPGWLFEANGVLHPRGSEYDVQFVMDGLPLTENRSPAYVPPVASDDVELMRVMTAGFPAEYGRKLGGVVEVTTARDITPGFHLTATGQGGSFGTAAGNVEMGYGRGANQFMITGDAGVTSRYLDPPVLANYTNSGSTGGFTAAYSRDLTDRDRLRFSFRREELHYMIPNELVQQESGQRQDAADAEGSGQADYERVISPTLLFSLEGSLRDERFRLWSNDLATPVILSQERGFTQGYGRVTLTGANAGHNWKIGADAIVTPAHESLQYAITNPSYFDPDTALHFAFGDRRTDVEPAAFLQDTLHWKNWNLALGLRYDHYHFVVTRSAWSPRVALSRYFAGAGVLVHLAYDRVFQTPSIENLLLASSPQLDQVSPLVLRLPVNPAQANYYEAGITKAFKGHLRFDANAFRRDFRNFSDDDTLLNTGVSFPISIASARIEGTEGKLTLPRWGRFSGAISYSNQVAVAQGPITGGLFIGSEAVTGVPDNSRFRVSQDQRNTVRARLHCELTKRLWVAAQYSYGSGLPVELDTGDTDYAFLLAQYGPRVLQQVDFARGRVRPSYSLDAGAGFNLYTKEDKSFSVQVQGSNLTDHLNVINFASLFSGTAVDPPRSLAVRLRMSF
jgi:hypothetical protein